MKKILVTGGAGNVGSALVNSLLKKSNYNITVVDNLRTGSIKNLPLLSKSPNLRFINADVNSRNEISSIFSSANFDYVFHYAALVGVKRTLDNPIDVLNDIEGIRNILSLSKNAGVKRVFYSSSSEVYGEPVEFPQNEYTTALNSRLPYAIVKNVGEAFFRSFYKEYGLEFSIFRFFNTYGPNQSDDFVVSKFITLALKNKPITIYGEGKQTRTFCYIDDNIDTTIKIFENGECINDVINIGNDIEVSIFDLAKLIVRVTNSRSEIVHLPALEEGDMTRRCPDNSKMKGLLNRELISIEKGVNKILQYRKVTFGKLI